MVLLQWFILSLIQCSGSGRDATVSSNGIYVDPTAPNITSLYHRDDHWDVQNQHVRYQGNNDTISIYWEAHDPESMVGDNNKSTG